MPEGHSVHRIARQFARSFTPGPVAVSSPQGRFTAGATRLDGHAIVQARAVGKQMFLEFDHGLWLRVHLGMYGAWDFAGDIALNPVSPAQNGARPATVVGANEDSPWSIGAPRRTRLRMAESERRQPAARTWPPEPVGQVRVRLLTSTAVADLRGPTVCEVLTGEEVDAVVARLGPDPLVDGVADPQAAQDRFVANVRGRGVPIAQLLMDQAVVAGIGNVYRAELLFRARLDPYRLGRDVPERTARELWRDWSYLLGVGVETGQMLTMDSLDEDARERARLDRRDRHWVYGRAGEPCRVCGTPIASAQIAARTVYWCPKDQT